MTFPLVQFSYAEISTLYLCSLLQAHRQKLIREEDVDSGYYQGGVLTQPPAQPFTTALMKTYVIIQEDMEKAP